ncbi:MAG: hypothetical protein AB1715_00375 [Acidobacteriota bacterium]
MSPIKRRALSKTESLFLLSGSLRVEAGEDKNNLAVAEVRPGECIDIPAGRVHRVAALKDSVIIEVSTPELEDDYGREKE